MKKLTLLGILLSLFAMNIQSQDIIEKTKAILKKWDYHTLNRELGQGAPVIQTSRGQSYVAGMSYEEVWFNRKTTSTYMFTDLDISSLKLRYWSQYMNERSGGKIGSTTEPVVRDSLIREFQIQDSLRNDSVKRILRMNPDLISSMNETAKEINARKKILYDLDSLRCDSLIHEISVHFGPPLMQDTTSHTEPSARYYAIWLTKGVAISLKDYVDYTDVVFSIPLLSEQIALAFGLEIEHEVFEKKYIQTGQHVTAMSLLVLPPYGPDGNYRSASLLLEPPGNKMFMEKLVDEEFTNPVMHYYDLDGDKIPEAWFEAETDSFSGCRRYQVFSLVTKDPVIVFDSRTDIYETVSANLLPGFQAELIFSDGEKYLFPIDRNSFLKAHYTNDGQLITNGHLVPGCIHHIRKKQDNEGATLIEGKIELLFEDTNTLIGHIIVNWELKSGYWKVVNYRFLIE